MAKSKHGPPPEDNEPNGVEVIPPPPVLARIFLEGFEHIDPDTYDFDRCWTRVHHDAEYNINDVVAAIVFTGGNWGRMSMLLGRNRQRIKDYVYSHKIALDVYNDITEANLDLMQTTGQYAAIQGDGPMIRFFLMTLGKERGFTTRVEQTGANGRPIETAEIPSDPQEASRVYQRMIGAGV